MIEIHERLLRTIYGHARACLPHECCGILVGNVTGGKKRVLRVVETVNAHSGGAGDRYRIPGKTLLRADGRARAEGLDIIGFYHSHPGQEAVPSGIDRDLAWEGYSYLIVSAVDDEPRFRSWLMKDRGEGLAEEAIIACAGEVKGVQG